MNLHYYSINQGDYTQCAKIPSWIRSDLSASDRIINGQKAPSAIPWQVHLCYGNTNSPICPCGGTILDAKTILTAAHCFYDKAEREHTERPGMRA